MRRLATLIPDSRQSRLLIAAIGVGVAVGVLVAGFDYLVVTLLIEHLIELPLPVLAVTPLLGLLITVGVLRTLGGGCSPSTSEEYIHAFHMRHPSMGTRPLVARMTAGTVTLGFGGALGLEGPSVYLGSAIGLRIQERFDKLLGRDAAKLLLTAGAAAGISALFQTPATGLVFALESPYRDDVAHRALLPSLIASAAGFLAYASMPFIESGTDWGFVALSESRIGGGELAGALAIGVGAGLGGRAFAWVTIRAKALPKHFSPWLLAAIGGIILGGLLVLSDRLFGAPLTYGPGYGVVEWLADDRSFWLILALFFARAVATLTTLGAGGAGGLFIPLAVQGILLGSLVGHGLDRIGWGDPTTNAGSLWTVLGLAAFLAAGYRTPIAAVMFVAESSRGAAVVPALIAAAMSQLVAGKASVSAAQQVERVGHLEGRVSLPLASALSVDVMTVPSDATVSEFVWVHAMGQRQRVVPVVDGSKYLGLCSLEAASVIDREKWEAEPISSIMDADGPVARPSWSLRDALAAMDQAGDDLIAVVDEAGNFAGVVYESEIVKLSEILDQTEGRDGAGEH